MAELPDMRKNALDDALKHLCDALELLDLGDAPPHIGAHVDLAMCQLRDAIGSTPEVPEAGLNKEPRPH